MNHSFPFTNSLAEYMARDAHIYPAVFVVLASLIALALSFGAYAAGRAASGRQGAAVVGAIAIALTASACAGILGWQTRQKVHSINREADYTAYVMTLHPNVIMLGSGSIQLTSNEKGNDVVTIRPEHIPAFARWLNKDKHRFAVLSLEKAPFWFE